MDPLEVGDHRNCVEKPRSRRHDEAIEPRSFLSCDLRGPRLSGVGEQGDGEAGAIEWPDENEARTCNANKYVKENVGVAAEPKSITEGEQASKKVTSVISFTSIELKCLDGRNLASKWLFVLKLGMVNNVTRELTNPSSRQGIVRGTFLDDYATREDSGLSMIYR